ncbi:MAG: translation initiation factor IF-2 [Kiritimatiellia bacterium]|nr:translation initiation factor IF-2 [Kiritimatiellia bacterium]
MRVYDLAKELNITSKELMAALRSINIAVKSHSVSIDEEAVQKIKSVFSKKAPKPPAKEQTVKKETPPQPTERKAEKTVSEPQVLSAASEKAGFMPAASVKAEVKSPAPKTAAATDMGHPPVPSGKTTVKQPEIKKTEESAKNKTLVFRGPIVVRDLAERMNMKPHQLIAELMMMSVFAAINERLEIKTVQQVAEKHGFNIELEKKSVEAKTLPSQLPDLEEEPDRPEDLENRPPVVTFLGHIDHGKTSLLDRIRNTAVAKGEAGGITQHIGAYTAEQHGKKITFLDTPGHAAFTAMRARGANMTDIAVIVIAADDGIMPQTEEAIKHAQAAKTAIIIAINKIDLPGANSDKVKRQLQSIDLTPEEWGGDLICVEVSALTGKNIDRLLEMILLQSEVLELKANPRTRARGFVIEAQMEPGRGPTANLLVTRGTLSVGDILLCGPYWGRVKAIINDHGIKVRKAVPSMPVKCLGLSGVPKAGEPFQILPDDKMARAITEQRSTEIRGGQMAPQKKVSLETIFSEMAANQRLELRLILKCDTQGSLEAIRKMLGEIKSEKVFVSIVLAAVGNVNENDVMLASASRAIIFGFNVSKEEGVTRAEKSEGVEIRLYSIIYDIFDQIKEAMSGMLKPETKERYVGRAEVRQVFEITKKGQIAGCLLVDGKVTSKCKARVKRSNDILYEGAVFTLKRFQDQVNEVREGQECGIRLDNFKDFKPGDIIEFFDLEKVPQTL